MAEGGDERKGNKEVFRLWRAIDNKLVSPPVVPSRSPGPHDNPISPRSPSHTDEGGTRDGYIDNKTAGKVGRDLRSYLSLINPGPGPSPQRPYTSELNLSQIVEESESACSTLVHPALAGKQKVHSPKCQSSDSTLEWTSPSRTNPKHATRTSPTQAMDFMSELEGAVKRRGACSLGQESSTSTPKDIGSGLNPGLRIPRLSEGHGAPQVVSPPVPSSPQRKGTTDKFEQLPPNMSPRSPMPLPVLPPNPTSPQTDNTQVKPRLPRVHAPKKTATEPPTVPQRDYTEPEEENVYTEINEFSTLTFKPVKGVYRKASLDKVFPYVDLEGPREEEVYLEGTPTKRQKDFLAKQKETFMNKLQSDNIINQLIQDGVLLPEMKESIAIYTQSNKERVRILLDYILTQRAFYSFMVAVLKCNRLLFVQVYDGLPEVKNLPELCIEGEIKDCMPFLAEDEVTWSELSGALNRMFSKEFGKGLTNKHLAHLGDILFDKQPSTSILSPQMIIKRKLSGRNFTFWEFFLSYIQLTKTCLLEPWKKGHIMGFVSMEKSRDLLLQRPVIGTFIIRFCDTHLAAISIASVYGDKSRPLVHNGAPITQSDLMTKSLAERLKEKKGLSYVFGTPRVPTKKAFGLSGLEEVGNSQC